MDLTQYMTWTPTLVLVLARVGGIMVSAPALGDLAVPGRLRYFLGVVVSLAAVGRMAHKAALPANAWDLAATVGGEFLIGAVIGYTARLVLWGVELGAFHVGQQMGLSLGEVLDPTADAPSDVVRRFFQVLAVVIFLTIGGHRMLLSALLGTFQAVPVMSGGGASKGMLDTVVLLLGASFVLALKTAAPVLIALLLATVALGALQKTIPACNTLSIGLSVRAMLGLAVMAVSLAGAAALIESFMKIWSDTMSAWRGAVP